MNENLKKAVSKIISTAMLVDQKLEDKKITAMEGMQIALNAVGWIWIFKNFQLIAEDFKALDEAGVTDIVESVKTELDLKSDFVEEVVENALEIILRLCVVMIKTRNEEPAKAA